MTIVTTDSRFQKLWMSSSEELYYKRQDAGGGNWEIGVHIIMGEYHLALAACESASISA